MGLMLGISVNLFGRVKRYNGEIVLMARTPKVIPLEGLGFDSLPLTKTNIKLTIKPTTWSGGK